MIKFNTIKIFEIIKVKADIHPNGDIYIEHKGTMHRIGQLDDNEEKRWRCSVPSLVYLKARKILKK